MTFLEIVQRARQECSIAGTGPLTVVNQAYQLKKLVDWTVTAWIEIQQMRRDWSFRWAETTQALISGGRVYDPSVDWSLDVAAWDTYSFKIYKTADGVASQSKLYWLTYPEFRDRCETGTISTGMPSYVTISPDGKVRFNALLPEACTLTAAYTKSVQTLAVDSDVPYMNAQWHMAIVWKVVQAYAAERGDSGLWQVADVNFSRYATEMGINELPEITWGKTLA
jgi:hypothetical protein